MSDEKTLFKAELVEKDGKKEIDITMGTTHLPYLCYALKLLEMQIENALIAKGMVKMDKPKIATPNDVNLLRKFLKR